MSKIEWTEKTWNPITGCTKISAGCKNCYAETIAKRFWGNRKFTDIQLHEDRLMQPIKWRKPQMIFVNSMSDLFHEDVPFYFIDDILSITQRCKQHTFQILTKRPERMLAYIKANWGGEIKLNNVWFGISAENQKMFDTRLPYLLQCNSYNNWISFEPLLEEISLDTAQVFIDIVRGRNTIEWVVVGGESGRKKRPFNPDWARKLRDQCKELKIPFFMKQIDKVQEIPKDLMIREYPLPNSL